MLLKMCPEVAVYMINYYYGRNNLGPVTCSLNGNTYLDQRSQLPLTNPTLLMKHAFGMDDHDCKQNGDSGWDREVRRYDRKNDNHHVQEWNIGPDFDKTLKGQVENTTEISHRATNGYPNNVNAGHKCQGEEQCDPRTVK